VEIVGRARMLRSTSSTGEIEATLMQENAAVFAARFTFVLLDLRATEKMLGRKLPEEWTRFARD
jgi:hypothetical protein